MTSEVHMPPIPRFLYRMIRYLQVVNFAFKQNHMDLRHAVLAVVAYQAHTCMFNVVTCTGQEKDKLAVDLGRM